MLAKLPQFDVLFFHHTGGKLTPRGRRVVRHDRLRQGLVAQRPQLVLLDEPTANLDIGYQIEMFRLLRNLAISEGFIAVVVTHELNLASELADELILMERAAALPRELRSKFSSRICSAASFALPSSSTGTLPAAVRASTGLQPRHDGGMRYHRLGQDGWNCRFSIADC